MEVEGLGMAAFKESERERRGYDRRKKNRLKTSERKR